MQEKEYQGQIVVQIVCPPKLTLNIIVYCQLRSFLPKTFDSISRSVFYSGPVHPNLGYSGAVQYYQVKTQDKPARLRLGANTETAILSGEKSLLSGITLKVFERL